MLERIGRMVDAAIGLAQARASLIVRDLEGAGAAAAGYLAAGIIAAMGLLVLLAGLAAALARPLGWPGALGVVGGLMLVCGIGLFAGLRSRNETARRLRREIELEAEQSAEVLRAAGGPDPDKASPAHGPSLAPSTSGIREAIIQTLTSNPQLVASTAFAVLSVLGPKRSLRILGTAASGAGVAASLLKAWKSVQAPVGSNGHIPPRAASDSRAAHFM